MLSECKHFSGQISRCWDEKLNGEEISKLKRHLESCGTCADYLKMYQALMHIRESFYSLEKKYRNLQRTPCIYRVV